MRKIKVSLPVVEFKEDNIYFVYSPALDLTGYDRTLKGARRSFEETLNYFLEYTLENQTLEKELKRLWNI
ncbi:hypothetical protein [Rhodoflexus caldus]|uniref:hypothetical protein n=1 Tax=Rhodoflexus caldus TaxID=2891236 RepID=UPI00202A1D37|nr:hypothetical protein [Rhodoflexus caldus]